MTGAKRPPLAITMSMSVIAIPLSLRKPMMASLLILSWSITFSYLDSSSILWTSFSLKICFPSMKYPSFVLVLPVSMARSLPLVISCVIR